MNYVDLLKKTSPQPNSIPNENLIVGCLILNTGFYFIINAFSLKRDEVLTILRNKNQYINENSESYALHFLYNYLDFNLNTEEIKEKYKLSNKFDLNIVNELRVLKEENSPNESKEDASKNQEDLKPIFEYKEEIKENPDLIEQTKKELKEEEEKAKECEEFIDLAEEHLENGESENINEIINDNNNVNVDSDIDTNTNANVDAEFNVDINLNNVNDEPIEDVLTESNEVVLNESNKIEYEDSNVFLNADFSKIKDTELYLLCNLYKDKLTELNDLRNKYNDVNDVIKYIKKELKEVLLIANECGIQLKRELSIVDWDGIYKECLVSNDGDNIRVKFKNMINDISVNNNEIMIYIQIANKTDMLVEMFEKQCKEGLKNAVNNDDEVLNILREYNEKTETE